jgi:hypothetical protein
MKHSKTSLLVTVCLLLATAAWAREDRLTNTGVAPAAEGKVVTSTDRNGNTGVEIYVKHMATPQSLTPARQTYTRLGSAARQGGQSFWEWLRINEDLEGSLTAATPYKDFDVLVTAEDSMKPESPSSTVILKGAVARK